MLAFTKNHKINLISTSEISDEKFDKLQTNLKNVILM